MEVQYLKEYLYKEVISKSKYDKLIGKKVIHPEDYLFLNLNQKQLKLLETLCKEYDIILEKLPSSITRTKTLYFLSCYHKLKKKLKEKEQETFSESKIKAIKCINEQMIQVRDTIFKGNIEAIYRLLTKCANNFENIQDREDIYQLGYELLLKAIDEYELNNQNTFLSYVAILIYNAINENYSQSDSSFLDSIERISEESELTKEQSDEYFLTSNYYGQEEYLIDLMTSKEIKKVVMTLPELEQKVLTLTYGLDDKGIRNVTDAAKELGISKQSVIFNKKRALISLNLPPRRDYLKSIYLSSNFFYTTSSYEEIEEIKLKTDIQTININTKNTIDFLIRSIPKSELAYLIQELPEKIQKIFSLYYGLNDGVFYNQEEISVKLGLSISNVYVKISEGIKLLIPILQKVYKQKYYQYYDKDYLDFMMYEYLTCHKVKCKIKRNSC